MADVLVLAGTHNASLASSDICDMCIGYVSGAIAFRSVQTYTAYIHNKVQRDAFICLAPCSVIIINSNDCLPLTDFFMEGS